MKYLNKKFSTPPNSKAFTDNWDAVFGDKPKPKHRPDWNAECRDCGAEESEPCERWCSISGPE